MSELEDRLIDVAVTAFCAEMNRVEGASTYQPHDQPQRNAIAKAIEAVLAELGRDRSES